MENNKLWLNEAMVNYKKKFNIGVLNILNAPASSGKTTFIFNDFLKNTQNYTSNITLSLEFNLNKVLYVCDTSMLKDSILFDNKNITKNLSKGDLSKAKDEKSLMELLENKDDKGVIKVITYSKLGTLLKNEACRYLILNHFNCIFMDEIHNLFKYSDKFDIEENKTYGMILDYLPTIVSKVLTLGITATPNRIYSYKNEWLLTNTIFTNEELKTIRSLNMDYIQTNDIMNWIKLMPFIIKNDEKIFIYTNTINQSKKYKEFFNNNNIKAEWLCSINNKTETTYIDDDGNEVKEKIPTMTKYQISLRKQLLETGLLPDNLKVIIVNGGYETGWNLKDKNVQTVFVDNTIYETQIQARNRVRHDVKRIFLKSETEKNYLKDYIIEYCYHFNGGYWAKETMDYKVSFPKLKEHIPENYFGKKLTNEDKKYLVENFAMHWCNQKSTNWQTFKLDLEYYGFIVKTFKGKNCGTYIFNNGEEIKKDNIREVIRLNNEELLISWLTETWDKERIPCNEVRDILDIGKKSWDKIIKSENVLLYLKNNRISINSIKGMGKTLYFKKY